MKQKTLILAGFALLLGSGTFLLTQNVAATGGLAYGLLLLLSLIPKGKVEVYTGLVTSLIVMICSVPAVPVVVRMWLGSHQQPTAVDYIFTVIAVMALIHSTWSIRWILLHRSNKQP
ncbi:MAG: hypothetical protein D8M52_06640 [Chlorobi bacterium]|nr:MAG: hypothetical protein F9K28_06985 [Bacteroidota bacterium]KXK34097.1 MAG: hypothetical protein UZ06_CHB003001500 [Chlorobi bacterium OLB6]MBE2266186.1 hypothetical protein [Flavobacteriales bacterium]MBL1161380.1 hypothetical protein [Chlorobiota bacterium]MBW7852667.1 hypothetical protein [Candidatus Kapabacteria bacterium]MCC6331073.1 hypothetical protein [Ignavibacteria bacterium]